MKVRARKQKSSGIGLPDSSQKQIPFVFPLSLLVLLIYCSLGWLINKLFIIILLYEQILINIKNGEKVDIEKAKVLKEEIELSRLKLLDEIEGLKELKEKTELSIKKAKIDIPKTSSVKSIEIKLDPKEIEDNATITIAINMLSEKLENKDLKISDKNIKGLKKLDDRLAKIL